MSDFWSDEVNKGIRADFSRIVALARSGSSVAQYAAAWTAGHELDPQDAVQEALTVAGSSGSRAGKPERRTSPLTFREQQVAVLVARGCSNRQIAESLVISEATAERHVANIFGKLSANSRAHVAAWVVQHGLVDPAVTTT